MKMFEVYTAGGFELAEHDKVQSARKFPTAKADEQNTLGVLPSRAPKS